MSGELAVLDILLSDSAVSGIVGTSIYLDQAPQSQALPYIIIEEDDVEPYPTKDGASANDKNIVRVFPYANSQDALITLAKACRDVLDEHASGIFRGVEVGAIRFESQTGFTEQIENRKVYAKDQEYSVRVIL